MRLTKIRQGWHVPVGVLGMLVVGSLAAVVTESLVATGFEPAKTAVVVGSLAVAGLVSIRIARRVLKWGWLEIFLGAHVVLFSLSFLPFARVKLGGYESPAYLLLLPVLGLLFLIRHTSASKLGRQLSRALLGGEVPLLGLLFILVLASVFVSVDKLTSIAAAAEVGIYFLGYTVFSCLVDSRPLWRRLVWLYVVLSVIVLGQAVYHYHFDPLHWGRLVAVEGRSPNQFAFALEMAAVILFGLAVTSDKWRTAGACLIGFGFCAYGLALTLSRGALVAIPIGLLVFLLLSLRQLKWRRLLMLLLLVIVVVSLTMPTAFWTRVKSIWDGATNTSSVRWVILERYVDEILSESPLTGEGFGVWVFVDAGVGRAKTKSSHNSFVTMWAGAGIVALLVLLAFLTVHGLNLWSVRVWFNEHNLWGNMLLATYATLLVHSLVTNFMWGHAFWALLGFQGAAISLHSKRSFLAALERAKNG